MKNPNSKNRNRQIPQTDALYSHSAKTSLELENRLLDKVTTLNFNHLQKSFSIHRSSSFTVLTPRIVDHFYYKLRLISFYLSYLSFLHCNYCIAWEASIAASKRKRVSLLQIAWLRHCLSICWLVLLPVGQSTKSASPTTSSSHVTSCHTEYTKLIINWQNINIL